MWFAGRVLTDGCSWGNVHYEYVVRDLDQDAQWRRDKIKADFVQAGVLRECGTTDQPLCWFSSKPVDEFLHSKLLLNPKYLIINE